MTTTHSVCQHCGVEPRPSARFCDGCGTALADHHHVTEYKQLTILFADVVRSMDIAGKLGAERLRELMTELVQQCDTVVQRYGGTMNQFTGDGFMALFGAPVAMEDHALRACLAALDIQTRARVMAADVRRRDGVALEIRVGLNSGEVVVGDIDSGPMRYTVSGDEVGMAQRMESVAAPGGVMLSASTARLVENQALLGEPQLVRIKGSAEPVLARPLLGVDSEHHTIAKGESRLVGRVSEVACVDATMRRAINGSGGVVAVVGPPGIGKSRLVRESERMAKDAGAEVFYTYCESHTRDVSFHVIARMLRAAMDVGGLPADQARARLRSRLGDRDERDIALLDELLGIQDGETPIANVSPEARRKRLVELLNSAVVARPSPSVYVVEDVHWIDSVSEALFADLAAALAHTRSLMIITYRPEYQGVLSDVAESQTIALAPLDHSESTELTVELLGADPSVEDLAKLVADRAAGVPFFAEEIVRDLAERGVLRGARGAYTCAAAIEDIRVPATLQAAIAARVDRLGDAVKQTLHAAAVIGTRFTADLVEKLVPEPELAALVQAELVDTVSTTPPAKFAFHHPLIQKVAYDSQLRSERAKLHRRLARQIEQVDDNAALIATHWEAAGDYHQAFDWHMRAGEWFKYRDQRAARTSWQRARAVADQLPDDDPDRLSNQIAPRTFICAKTFRVGGDPADTGFAELQELTTLAGDKTSLIIGMAGYLTTLAFRSRHREASDLASEFVTLVESTGDPAMIVGLLCAAAQAKYEAGEVSECLRLAERVIEVANGDAAMGSIMVATPLSWALALRGIAKMCLGQRRWLADLDQGLAIGMPFDVGSRINTGLYKFVVPYQNGAALPDAPSLALTADWLREAEDSGEDTAVTLARLIRAITLIHASPASREEGVGLLVQAYDRLSWLSSTLRRMADVEIADFKACRGDLDAAIASARATLDEQFETGEMITRGVATRVLVEALLRRGAPADLDSARAALDRLAAVGTQPGFILHELPILRLRALLANAEGDDQAFREYLARYRRAAVDCEFVGHVAAAERMSATLC